jgi:corrinoid protein of di/trimethylamine methyltransferase
MSEEMFRKLAQVVVDGEREPAESLAAEALKNGLDPLDCINKGLNVGIAKVGDLYDVGEFFLPDLIAGSDAMKAAIDVFELALANSNRNREIRGRVLLGTVKGDLHEIGKTLVGTMLSANGFQVTDIGVDKAADEFLAVAKETKATLVGASATLTTTIFEQAKIILVFKEAGLRDKVKIVIGGAPVTQSWAEEIGADGFAEDAIAAVTLAKKLLPSRA